MRRWLVRCGVLAVGALFVSCERGYVPLSHGYSWYTTQGPSDHAPRAHLVHKSANGIEVVVHGVDPIESIIIRDESLIVFRATQDGNRVRGLYAFKPGHGMKLAMATNPFDVFKVSRTADGIHAVGFQEGVERNLTWKEIESCFPDSK